MAKGRFSGQTEFRGGFSTLEMLIAMAILILVLSSVVTVSFGGQAILSDNEIAGEALKSAQELLEAEQALARKDFKLVNPVPETSDGIYRKRVLVETAADYLTKKVTSIVAWTGEHGRNLDIRLTALVTNFEEARGGDTCNSITEGQNWTAPTYTSYWLREGDLLQSGFPGDFPVADIDTFGGKMYVSALSASFVTSPILFVFDITNSSIRPPYVGSVDNAPTLVAGLAAIHTDGKYVFAASSYGANFAVCGENANCAQLQVFDVSTPSSPTLVKNFKVPGVAGSGGQAAGRSIFYKDGYVYLGLSKTASGPEFNIIDVHNPLNPIWVGGAAIGYDVNAIIVRKNFAYVASPSPQELIIFNIANPANPSQTSGYNTGNGAHGKSFYAVGDTLYFGRTFGAEEFHILDNENPPFGLPALGIRDMGSFESVRGIIVRSILAFILSNNEFHILDISNPVAMTEYAPLFLLSGVSPASDGKTLECEGNNLYLGSVDGISDEGAITVIKPGI